MMVPALVLATELVPCGSVGGKPELCVWDPRAKKKKACFIKRQDANMSSYITLHSSSLGAAVEWLTHLMDTVNMWVSLFLLPCPKIPHPCCTRMGWFSLSPFKLEPPGLEFLPYTLPAIDKMPKLARVCVFLCESGLQFNSAFAIWGDGVCLKLEFSFTSQP